MAIISSHWCKVNSEYSLKRQESTQKNHPQVVFFVIVLFSEGVAAGATERTADAGAAGCLLGWTDLCALCCKDAQDAIEFAVAATAGCKDNTGIKKRCAMHTSFLYRLN